MSKIYVRNHHKDALDGDHSHRLPDGSYTGGMLLKPNSDRSFPHTHLYTYNMKTCETGPAPIGGDHTHTSIEGETSGPMPVRDLRFDEDNLDAETNAEKKIGEEMEALKKTPSHFPGGKKQAIAIGYSRAGEKK